MASPIAGQRSPSALLAQPPTPQAGVLPSQTAALLDQIGNPGLTSLVTWLNDKHPTGWAITGSTALQAHAIKHNEPTAGLPPPNDVDLVITDPTKAHAITENLLGHPQASNVDRPVMQSAPPSCTFAGTQLEIHHADSGVFGQLTENKTVTIDGLRVVALPELVTSKEQALEALKSDGAEQGTIDRAQQQLSALKNLNDKHGQPNAAPPQPLAGRRFTYSPPRTGSGGCRLVLTQRFLHRLGC